MRSVGIAISSLAASPRILLISMKILVLLLWAGQALALNALELRARLDKNPYAAARNAEHRAVEARSHGDELRRLEALTLIAMAYNLVGDSSRAISPHKEAKALAIRLHQQSTLALLYGVEGEFLGADNQMGAATEAFEKGIATAQAAKDADAEAIVRAQYGATLGSIMGKHLQATQQIETALLHFEKKGDRARQAEARSAFASLYEFQRNYKRSIAERRKALALISPETQTYLAASIYYDLGSNSYGTDKDDEAGKALRRSIELSRSIGDNFSVAFAQSALAKIEMHAQRWNAAIALMQEARPILEQGGNPVSTAFLDARLAVCLARTGQPSAWNRLRSAESVLGTSDNIENEHTYREAEIQVNAVFKRFEQAYRAQKRLLQIERKIFETSQNRQLTEFSVRYQIERRETENARLRLAQRIKDVEIAHQRTRQITLTAGLTITLLALFTIIFLLRRQTRLKARFEELALRDELTGAPNRRAIMAQAEQLNARTEGATATLGLVDLDHFKQVNDNWGHDVGDEVLRSFYLAACEALRAGDMLGRTGGEEWLLLLPETPSGCAETTFLRIREALQALQIKGVPSDYRLRFSMGLAHFREGETLSETLRRADLALYRAKKEGRDRVVLAP